MQGMRTSGKILYYNANEGVGIIMTAGKEKYRFDIESWEDYDALPAAGMEVVFVPEADEAFDISRKAEEAAGSSVRRDEEAGSTPAFDPEAPIVSSIRLKVTPSRAIREYFERIDAEIQERTMYKSAKGRLDFLRIRRFLFTTYNNLTELDTHFITPELKAMRDDLMQMSQVYDDYRSKATYPDVAFDKVFLSRQPDYVQLRYDAEFSFAELKRLHVAEQQLSEALESKEELLQRTLRLSPKYEELETEVRSIKKNYVDTIHLIASLNERYREASRIMKEFEHEHHQGFFDEFSEASRTYRSQILYILDAQAFMFDDLLWRQAKKSRIIKHFFEQSHIQGDYCAKTYLRYYLNTLDPELLSTEQQELFELYDYLDSLEHQGVLVLVHDIEDAMRLKSLVTRVDRSILVEAFVDERKALSWSYEKEPGLLIVEDTLQSFSSRQFINAFKKKVSLQPMIIMLSNADPDSFNDIEGVEYVMRKGFADKEMSKAVKELLESEEEDG